MEGPTTTAGPTLLLLVVAAMLIVSEGQSLPKLLNTSLVDANTGYNVSTFLAAVEAVGELQGEEGAASPNPQLHALHVACTTVSMTGLQLLSGIQA